MGPRMVNLSECMDPKRYILEVVFSSGAVCHQDTQQVLSGQLHRSAQRRGYRSH